MVVSGTGLRINPASRNGTQQTVMCRSAQNPVNDGLRQAAQKQTQIKGAPHRLEAAS